VQLTVAQRVKDTEAEGPGRRYALWVQGCTLRCPGCCNPEMFTRTGGAQLDSAALADEALALEGLEGVAVLGGEPFEQAAALADFCTRVKEGGLSVMLYSGYRLEELRAMDTPGVAQLLSLADLLVDGRYQQGLPEPRRRWIGSSNQRLHFLSDRYRADDARFLKGNTVELRLENGKLTVNGWPQAADAFRRSLK
jgi:anaerobic ribonucleoside-triphosphate reductase activating protein